MSDHINTYLVTTSPERLHSVKALPEIVRCRDYDSVASTQSKVKTLTAETVSSFYKIRPSLTTLAVPSRRLDLYSGGALALINACQYTALSLPLRGGDLDVELEAAMVNRRYEVDKKLQSGRKKYRDGLTTKRKRY